MGARLGAGAASTWRDGKTPSLASGHESPRRLDDLSRCPLSVFPLPFRLTSCVQILGYIKRTDQHLPSVVLCTRVGFPCMLHLCCLPLARMLLPARVLSCLYVVLLCLHIAHMSPAEYKTKRGLCFKGSSSNAIHLNH